MLQAFYILKGLYALGILYPSRILNYMFHTFHILQGF